jgi:hypothetical protein
MIEIVLLTFAGSLYSFFPVWRYWKKNSSLMNSSSSYCQTTTPNNLVLKPNGVEPNFHCSNSVQLCQVDLEFVKTFLNNALENSTETQLVSTVPTGIIEKMQRLPGYSNTSFTELTIQEQSYVIFKYLESINHDQTLLGAGATFEGQITQLATNFHSQHSSANNAGSDGNFGLLIWFILSLFFIFYNGFRIYQLKESQTKSVGETKQKP